MNQFCFPCCGYYCDNGSDCPCPDCKEEWVHYNITEDDGSVE